MIESGDRLQLLVAGVTRHSHRDPFHADRQLGDRPCPRRIPASVDPVGRQVVRHVHVRVSFSQSRMGVDSSANQGGRREALPLESMAPCTVTAVQRVSSAT